MNSVFNRILELKTEKKMTWDELSKAANIPVSSWMTGLPTMAISDAEIKAIASVLGVTYRFLKNGK